MIKFNNISAGYKGDEKLHSISCSFEKNEITVIVGPNGSGKTTLFKALTGIIPYTNGEILLDNENIEGLSTTIAQKIAYLPQNRNIPAITVERMVLHGRFPYLKYPRKYKKQDYEIATSAMKRVGVLEYASRSMNTMSGGERQKVYLAMAIAQDTEVILLDEPTTYLDIYGQLELLNMAGELKALGKTVIMILHDLNMALQVADKIIVIDKGEIAYEGQPKDIIDNDLIKKVFNVRTNTCVSKDSKLCYLFEI